VALRLDPEYNKPSITSQKGDRSIGTVSSGVVQENPTVSTSEVEPRGNVPDNKQKGEARVERSFTLGVEAK